MGITFDPSKRDKALRERGLDFAEAAEIFVAPTVSWFDVRYDYGEDRVITAGRLKGRAVLVA